MLDVMYIGYIAHICKGTAAFDETDSTYSVAGIEA